MQRKPMSTPEKAKAIIEQNLYMNIATVTPEGQPWNTPVYFRPDEHLNLYWASWRENEHSKNIRHASGVFITIYDSTQPEGTGEGVYLMAKAYELTVPEEVQEALDHYMKGEQAADFLDACPRRMYKAVPEKMWLNGEGEIDGRYIDTREEIAL